MTIKHVLLYNVIIHSFGPDKAVKLYICNSIVLNIIVLITNLLLRSMK